MDESFWHAADGLFVVGGLLGRGVPVFELERKWEALRKRSDIDIDFFKASHCERGSGEFAKFVVDPNKITALERAKLDSISRKFIALVQNEEGIIVHGVAVDQANFYDLIKDPLALAILGPSPYRLAYDLAMIQCGWAMKKLGTGDLVSFVCDEHEQYSQLANEAYTSLKSNRLLKFSCEQVT